MRLTLRTLLAFMDDILDPKDAHAIGQKVEKSEYAQQLVRRIRDVLRQRALAAPDLTGPGAKLDPNTVAEYLDNTLPPERVPVIEKVCLDSDAHLAEAASCHQVLSLVLTEAAEIRPNSRRRMYGLVKDATAAAQSSEASQPATHEEPVPAPDQPGPLAALPGWLLPVSVAVAVAILGLVGLMMFSPPEQVAESGRTIVPRRQRHAGQPTPPAQDDTEEAPAQPVGQPSETGGAGATPVSAEPEPSEPAEETQAPADAGAKQEVEQPDTTDRVEPTPPEPPKVAETSPAPAPPEQPKGPVEIGQYVSVDQVLLLADAENQRWNRLPGRTKIFSGDRLVAFPAFRAKIAIGNGDMVELLGIADGSRFGTEATVLGPDELAAFGLRLSTGRAVVTSANGGTDLALQFDDLADADGALQHWRVNLLDPATRIGVEVRRIPPVGFQPQRGVSARAELYVESGRITVTHDGQAQTIAAPSGLLLAQRGDAPAVQGGVAEVPSWITARTLPPLQRNAAKALHEEIPIRLDDPDDDEKTVRLALMEQARSDEEEVQLLAAQCLSTLGLAEVLAKIPDTATGESAEPARRAAIDGMRAWLARGPQAAAQLEQILILQRGQQDGGLRYRLLWGYSDADVRDPQAMQKLLDLLSHDDLGVRELAVYNLRLAGGRTAYNFRAHDPPAKRERAARQLRGLYEENKLMPRPRREL